MNTVYDEAQDEQQQIRRLALQNRIEPRVRPDTKSPFINGEGDREYWCAGSPVGKLEARIPGQGWVPIYWMRIWESPKTWSITMPLHLPMQDANGPCGRCRYC